MRTGSRRRSRGHSLCVVGILALAVSLAIGLDWVACAHHTWALASGPMEAIKGSIDDALRILADKDLQGKDKSKERRQKLEAVVSSRFSYEEMSRRTLGAQWAKMSEAEREEFVELFRGLLVNSYADRVESYSGDPINYVGERVENEYAEVRTRVMLGQAEVPLDYRLIKRDGDWRVYDVVIDGISLVSNYRGQFSKILKNGSYQDLVEQLRKKSDKLAASSKIP